MCKKKFLNYLDDENSEQKVTREEREAARENMEKFIMRNEADQMRGGRRKQKIISNEMIAVFMAFLTYGHNKRRNFLLNDISIEEAFEVEVAIKPHIQAFNDEELDEQENLFDNTIFDASINEDSGNLQTAKNPSLRSTDSKRPSMAPGSIKHTIDKESLKTEMMLAKSTEEFRMEKRKTKHIF